MGSMRRPSSPALFILAAALVAFFFMPTGKIFCQTPAIQPQQSGQPAAAPQTQTSVPESATLANGMELITLVQPAAKNVAVSLAFRGGADIQTPQNSGLFNLLESVLFNGTAAIPGEPEPAGALEALGPQALGGGIKADRFEFSSEVAPDRIVQVLDTIAYLFSDLRLEAALSDPNALSAAKAMSLARINAQLASPDSIFEAALAKKLFSRAPWRLDPLGAESVVSKATPDELRSLDEAWFVPNNAVLVICGNIDPKVVLEAAEKSFASYEKAKEPNKAALAIFPKPGVTVPTFMVYPDPSVAKGEATIEMRYRGPDSTSLPYFATAMVWAELAGEPKGRLELAIAKNMPKWSNPSELVAEFEGSRDASWISLSSRLQIGSRTNVADTAFAFKEAVRSSEFYAMKSNPGYFTQAEYAAAKKAILDRMDAELSNPSTAAALLSDCWLLGGSQFYSRLRDEFSRVTDHYLMNFANEYFMQNLEVTAVRLNPADYEANRKSFLQYGFAEINGNNAFWWK